MDKIFFVNIKKSCWVRAHLLTKEAQATIWEKVFVNHRTHQEVGTKKYNEFSKLNNEGKQTF